MTLFVISALFLALAGCGIYLRGRRASPSERSIYARIFEGPDGTRYETTSISRINESDPGPQQTCFEPSAILRK
jgi:outer membrane lipopolysaccharide assembly protein LptE/RlpB